MTSPSIVPVPVKENGQLATPGMAPLPLMLIVTVEPVMWPVPVPVMFAVPMQTAVKLPAMSVSLWLVMVQAKFVQLDGLDALGSSGVPVLVLLRWTSQPATVTTAATRMAEYKRARFIVTCL
jgi:hypothetical protein